MIKTNLKLGFRNLATRKGYSFINSVGLSIGIASCLLISLYVQNQFSYDESFEDADRIYKMLEEQQAMGDAETNSHVPYSFVGIIPKDYPEVESATAVAGPFPNQRVYVLDQNRQKISFLENNVLIADNSFFSVFSFKMLKGDRKTALKNPNSIVLSQTTAKRYFGDQDPLGKFISVSGKSSIVTGVCEDPPINSHFKFSYIVSSTSVRWFSQSEFNLRRALCYFKLKPEASVKELERKFPSIVDQYIAVEIERIHSVSWEEYKADGNGFRYYLEPLTDIHLNPEIAGGMKAGGNIAMLRILIAVAILIFGIGCINFMNLSTARSLERAKEVGVRKVMGSQKWQLVFQFLTESFLITVISIIMAIGLVLLLLPAFNELSESELHFKFDWITIIRLLIASILITFLAGLYPAFVLSSFQPISVLKGNFSSNTKGKWIKNSLMIFQFSISIILISSTLILIKQTQFLSNQDLGYDTEDLVIIEGLFHMDGNFSKPFLEEIRTMPEIKGAAGTLWVQGFQGTWMDEYQVDGSSDVHTLPRVLIGDQLAEVMDFELIEGSFFSDQSDDAQSILLNQSALDVLQIKQPIGKKISMIDHDEGGMQKTEFTIKGVIQNFNYQSLHSEIAPLVIQSNENKFGRTAYLVVKLDGKNLKKTLTKLEEKWKVLIPERPFNFRFMDDVLEANYKSEEKLSIIFMLFSGLSIAISLMGLFAFSAYTISLREKEIGIRKVIGASYKNILSILSGSILKIIVISFLIATPFSWFFMNRWLSNFAYRVEMSYSIFLFSGILIFSITFILISLQTLKVSRIDPIESLKNE